MSIRNRILLYERLIHFNKFVSNGVCCLEKKYFTY